METKHGTKYRQLHMEDYLREIPAEQGRVTEVSRHHLKERQGLHHEAMDILNSIIQSTSMTR